MADAGGRNWGFGLWVTRGALPVTVSPFGWVGLEGFLCFGFPLITVFAGPEVEEDAEEEDEEEGLASSLISPEDFSRGLGLEELDLGGSDAASSAKMRALARP